jgi:hypothetical protein
MYLTILIFLHITRTLGEEDGSRRMGMMQMMQKMMMERMDMNAQNIIKIPAWPSSILYSENRSYLAKNHYPSSCCFDLICISFFSKIVAVLLIHRYDTRDLLQGWAFD